MSNRHLVYFNYIMIVFINYTALNLKKKKEKQPKEKVVIYII